MNAPGPRPAVAAAPARERLVALDALRGLAVAGMILVTSPGDWGAAWSQLQHAPWDGARAADMVFPGFLFAVGAALGLSFPRAWGPAEARRFGVRVARRVAALLAVGLALEATYNLLIGFGAEYPGAPGLANIRLPGILQRIALCYALGAGVAVATGRRDAPGRLDLAPGRIGLAVAAVLAGYWAAMAWVPVPGFGAGRLDPAGNLAAYIDRAVFTVPHLWPLGTTTPTGGPRVYDPEGLLSTLPAATDLLFGMLAAAAIRRAPGRAAGRIALAGAALVAGGLLLDPLFVINKRIWTSSFALLSSGIAALAFAALLAAAPSRAAVRAMAPLRVLGGNAILAFVISTVLGRIDGFAFIPTADGPKFPQQWLDERVLRVVGDPGLASFLCALAVLALVTAILWPLHRRAIHFRV